MPCMPIHPINIALPVWWTRRRCVRCVLRILQGHWRMYLVPCWHSTMKRFKWTKNNKCCNRVYMAPPPLPPHLHEFVTQLHISSHLLTTIYFGNVHGPDCQNWNRLFQPTMSLPTSHMHRLSRIEQAQHPQEPLGTGCMCSTNNKTVWETMHLYKSSPVAEKEHHLVVTFPIQMFK